MRLAVAVEIALDRLGVLLDQLDSARDISRRRLEGLGDDEYLWEPVPGAWSVRPRGKAVSAEPYGPGEWQLDFQLEAPEPPPVTTVAWRLGHLTSGIAGRWEWTFGPRRLPPEDLVEFTPRAAEALAEWQSWLARWREGLAALTSERLDQVGFGQYPWGLDRTIPFVGIVWWTNQEVIHHLAEIALLRDLWQAGVGREQPGTG
jgi:DinB superfamily